MSDLPGVYSDRKIIESMETGDIVISPYHRSQLGTSSYDVRLGEYYFAERKPSLLGNLYNIYDFEEVQRVWGANALRAQEAWGVLEGRTLKNVRPQDRVILLAPGETILAHTQEFIGGLHHITTMMKARSSLGRSFLEICKCAGWGDVGYINRWTMEITNNSQHYSIPLVVGRRIAQIVFFETGPILDGAEDYSKSGKYQTSADIRVIREQWRPTDMLPRLFKDRDLQEAGNGTDDRDSRFTSERQPAG